MKRIKFKVQIIVEPDKPGFHAYCPALKGLHIHGETYKNALRSARDAAIAYLTSIIKHEDLIPIGIGIDEKGEEIVVPVFGLSHEEANEIRSRENKEKKLDKEIIKDLKALGGVPRKTKKGNPFKLARGLLDMSEEEYEEIRGKD